MNLINIIQSLRLSRPGSNSIFLHEQFQIHLKATQMSTQEMHDAIDDAALKMELGLDDRVVEVIANVLKCTRNHTDEIDKLLKENKKIYAIKLYRDTFKTSLVDAKNAINLRIAELNL